MRAYYYAFWALAAAFLISLLSFYWKNDAPNQSRPKNRDKYIITLAGRMPRIEDLAQQVEIVDLLPLNGVVFTFNYRDPVYGDVPFENHIWHGYSIPYEHVEHAATTLARYPLCNLTENFLRLDVVPGDVDWFHGNTDAVIENFRSAARIARIGRLRGLFVDTEPYNRQLFNFAAQPGGPSFSDYATQVRHIGRNIGRAVVQEYPDIRLFLTFGYGVAFANGTPLPADSQYSLYPAFLDGLFDGVGTSSGTPKIINGNEGTYGCLKEYCFQYTKQNPQPRGSSSSYSRLNETAFALWLDKIPPQFNPSKLDENYFSPGRFAESLALALKLTDRYVWIYHDKTSWLGAADQLPMPSEYHNIFSHFLIDDEHPSRNRDDAVACRERIAAMTQPNAE